MDMVLTVGFKFTMFLLDLPPGASHQAEEAETAQGEPIGEDCE